MQHGTKSHAHMCSHVQSSWWLAKGCQNYSLRSWRHLNFQHAMASTCFNWGFSWCHLGIVDRTPCIIQNASKCPDRAYAQDCTRHGCLVVAYFHRKAILLLITDIVLGQQASVARSHISISKHFSRYSLSIFSNM